MRLALLLTVVLLGVVTGCSTRPGLSQVQVDDRFASAGFVERDFADMHPMYP